MLATGDDAYVITAADKGLPQRAFGMTVADFLASVPSVGEFWTPLIVLNDDDMQHNVRAMESWRRESSLELMPHGKTTMAPALWQRQLQAGARGMTFATMGQARTGRAFGVSCIMLANTVVDARSLEWLVGELADPEFEFTCWVDSIEGADAMDAALATLSPPRPVDVCVELGASGGRGGARSIDTAKSVAEHVTRTSTLRLAGVSGYEGALGHDRSNETLAVVRAYLEKQLELHQQISGLYDDGQLIVTAGGSAFPDVVADVYRDNGAGNGDRTMFVIRPGAYIVHDDGFYRRISPFDEGVSAPTIKLRNAMRGLSRVIARPEEGLALLDAGKRDFPFDEGLPIPRSIVNDTEGSTRPARGTRVDRLNDQHTFLLSEGPAPRVGEVITLGLSHPCTAFDKWRLLPVVTADSSVVELIRTYF